MGLTLFVLYRYLRCVLNWVLNYSGWRVAMWSGSRKSVVVRSLLDLDLGLVKPDGTPRHPHMVALWTREDFQLTRKDFGQWVAIVKDLDRLVSGCQSAIRRSSRRQCSDSIQLYSGTTLKSKSTQSGDLTTPSWSTTPRPSSAPSHTL